MLLDHISLYIFFWDFTWFFLLINRRKNEEIEISIRWILSCTALKPGTQYDPLLMSFPSVTHKVCLALLDELFTHFTVSSTSEYQFPGNHSQDKSIRGVFGGLHLLGAFFICD